MTKQLAQPDFSKDDAGREAVGLGDWEVDLSTDTARCSRGTETLLGYRQPSGVWPLAVLLDTFLADDRPAIIDAFAAARSTGTVEFEKRIRRRDGGAVRWLHVKGVLRGGSTEGAKLVGVVTDVTEWRALEDRRRQAEKMEAIGHVCGRIAHDYNNFLMAVGANLEMFQEQPAGSDRARRFYSAAQDGLDRGARFNQGLMGISGRHELRLNSVRLDSLVSSAENALRVELGDLITLEINPPAKPLMGRTDAEQFEAALVHLASNARDAMPTGGHFTLSLFEREVRGNDASVSGVVPGTYVVVSVVDTGAGIEEHAMARVFEPFFTTKAYRRAKGLGLSQVYTLAKQSGGFVSIESEPARGTSVFLYFPSVS